MPQLTTESFKFMAELWANNNKAWFEENRKRYDQHVRLPMKAMVKDLTEPVMTILPEFFGKPKVSRINNDIRFTPNKPPYKEHIWISFLSSPNEGQTADLFVGINRNGWFVGSGTGSSKREPLDTWRRNLIELQDLWRRYIYDTGYVDRFDFYYEDKYKKPLFENIPEEMTDLIQSKGVWIVEKSKSEFKDDPAKEFFRGLCRMLPIQLFMITPTSLLQERLSELQDNITPPDDDIARLWSSLKS